MMAEEQDDNDEVLLKELGNQLETIKNIQPDNTGLYNCISVFASLLLEFRDNGNDPNWVEKVKTMNGNDAFSDKADQDKINAFMQQYGHAILNVLGLGVEDKETILPQSGGAGDPKDRALQALASISEFIDPRSVSLDGAVEFILEYLDSANIKMEDMARQIGFIALENKVHGIPLQPIGIPYEIPTRLLIIIVQGIFEVMRLFSLFGFPGAGIFRIVGSLFGGIIELFKGDWKSALFTFMGLAGSNMMTMGLFGKIIVKVLSFMAPSMRDKLVLTGYQSMKSWVLGVALFVFQTMAPYSIKQMVDQNLKKFGDMLADVQKKIDTVNGQITSSAEFKCFTIEWLNLTDPAKTPDYDSLIKLQDLFMQPSFYCNNDVRAFVDQMKFIPPARIILELLGLPTTDRAYSEVCWNLPPDVIDGGLDTAILHSLKPVIRPVKPFTPATEKDRVEAKFEGSLADYNKKLKNDYVSKYYNCPGFDMSQLRVAAAVAQKKLSSVFSLGESKDEQLTQAASTIRTGTTKFIGDSAATAAVAGKKAKAGVMGLVQQVRGPVQQGQQQQGQQQQQGKQPTMAMMPGTRTVIPPGGIAVIGQQGVTPRATNLGPLGTVVHTQGLSLPQQVGSQVASSLAKGLLGPGRGPVIIPQGR